jgi:4-amino-4-deoxy-L-arabinose transferase-like glycosyltransferase
MRLDHAVLRGLSGGRFQRFQSLVVAWVMVPVILFSLSNAKLPQYILPVFPALAILTGQTLMVRFNDQTTEKKIFFSFPGALCSA